MAVEGPAQGTNMGSMQALNTSSSVNGATTWFLNQRMSLKHNIQNHGSVGGGGGEGGGHVMCCFIREWRVFDLWMKCNTNWNQICQKHQTAPRRNEKKNSPNATRIPSMKLQGQSIASCIRGPRNKTCKTRQVLTSDSLDETDSTVLYQIILAIKAMEEIYDGFLKYLLCNIHSCV